MINLIVDLSNPRRLDKYLKNISKNLTQGLIQKKIRIGKIKVNGNNTFAGFRLSKGDKVTLYDNLIYQENKSAAKPSFHTIQLADKLLKNYMIYSDEYFIAINKPSGLAVQGGSKIKLSIDDALSYLNTQGYSFKLVHRIDKDTSGVLLIAKDYSSAYQMTKAFKEKSIKKRYLAIVQGKPREQIGKIVNYIKKRRSSNGFKRVQEDNNGKIAITYYNVLESNGNFSIIEFLPETGRMHQIRVHATYLGCSIIGDQKYQLEKPIHNSHSLLLHAESIILPKSLFGKDVYIQASLPKYFEETKNLLFCK